MPEFQNIEIIGIVGNARILDLRNAATPIIFLSCLQYPGQWGDLIVRTNGPPEALAKTVGYGVESLGHEYALSTKTIPQVISGALVEERVTAMLSSFFAALALLLASIGLYGLMSYSVTRRAREIGIRVAVGAQRENVLWLVLRETLGLALLGIGVGIRWGRAAGRLVGGVVLGVAGRGVPTTAFVSMLLLLVALFEIGRAS